MRMSFATLPALLAGAAALALTAPNFCERDCCVRAVRSMDGAEPACSKYLLSTVTESVEDVTATATVTAVESATITDTVIITTTIATTTFTSITGTVTNFDTITNTATLSETVTAATETITVTVTKGVPIKKRQNDLPSNAPPICNARKFKAACACIGVQPSTTTMTGAPATATQTVTSVQTVVSTATTNSVSPTFTTLTSTATIYLTVDATITESASTVTTAQVTQTTITTQTVDPPAPQCTAFQLQISSTGGANGQYLMSPPTGVGNVVNTNTLSSATWFILGSGGVRVYAHPSSSLDQTPVNFWRATSTSIGTLQQSTSEVNFLSCSIDATSNLQCVSTTVAAQNTFYRCPNFLNGIAFAQPAVIMGNPTYRQYCTERLQFVVINRTPATCAP